MTLFPLKTYRERLEAPDAFGAPWMYTVAASVTDALPALIVGVPKYTPAKIACVPLDDAVLQQNPELLKLIAEAEARAVAKAAELNRKPTEAEIRAEVTAVVKRWQADPERWAVLLQALAEAGVKLGTGDLFGSVEKLIGVAVAGAAIGRSAEALGNRGLVTIRRRRREAGAPGAPAAPRGPPET